LICWWSGGEEGRDGRRRRKEDWRRRVGVQNPIFSTV
jgi:hypothetical protein